jgi:hypothetical protein
MNRVLVNSLGGFSQLGMVVADADKTMHYMARKLGIGPFFVVRGTLVDAFYFRGAPAAGPVMTLGFAQASLLRYGGRGGQRLGRLFTDSRLRVTPLPPSGEPPGMSHAGTTSAAPSHAIRSPCFRLPDGGTIEFCYAKLRQVAPLGCNWLGLCEPACFVYHRGAWAPSTARLEGSSISVA